MQYKYQCQVHWDDVDNSLMWSFWVMFNWADLNRVEHYYQPQNIEGHLDNWKIASIAHIGHLDLSFVTGVCLSIEDWHQAKQHLTFEMKQLVASGGGKFAEPDWFTEQLRRHVCEVETAAASEAMQIP